METFCIGELDPTSPAIPELEICSKKQPSEIAQKLKDLTKQYWAVPVAAASLSVVVGFLYLRRKWRDDNFDYYGHQFWSI